MLAEGGLVKSPKSLYRRIDENVPMATEGSLAAKESP